MLAKLKIKRQGSVLLQTLVMCIVLSFIAVSLTRWVMARYNASNNDYLNSTFNGGGIEESSKYFSKFSSWLTYSPSTNTVCNLFPVTHICKGIWCSQPKCIQEPNNLMQFKFHISENLKP